MALDDTKNFCKVIVSTGYTSTDTSIDLVSGDGAKLPTPPFNLVWYNDTDYPDVQSDPNKEIVRVTAVSGDTLTVTRGQEGTTAVDHNLSGKTYKMINAITKKMIDDINSHIIDTSNPHSVTASQVGAITKVEDDTNPKLGGELDAQTHSIGFTLQTYTGNVGTTTIDWTKGNKAKFMFGSGNETLVFTAPSKPCNLLLMVVQDSTGGRTLTFPSNVKWVGGTAPTLSTSGGAIDIISFFYDGTNYYGQASLNFE